MTNSEEAARAINRGLKKKLAEVKAARATGDNYPFLPDFKVGIDYQCGSSGEFVLNTRGYEKLYHRIFP